MSLPFRLFFISIVHLFVLGLPLSELSAQKSVLKLLSVDKKTRDFGRVEMWNNPTATFQVRNVSGQQLIFLPIMYRRDVRVEIRDRSLEPGATSEVSVTYFTEKKGAFSKSVEVYFNLSEKPLQLTVKGDIRSFSSDAYTSCPVVNRPKSADAMKALLEVVVLDSLTGEPLKSADVRIERPGMYADMYRTNSKGQFKEEAALGFHLISATAEGYTVKHSSFLMKRPYTQVVLKLLPYGALGSDVVVLNQQEEIRSNQRPEQEIIEEPETAGERYDSEPLAEHVEPVSEQERRNDEQAQIEVKETRPPTDYSGRLRGEVVILNEQVKSEPESSQHDEEDIPNPFEEVVEPEPPISEPVLAQRSTRTEEEEPHWRDRIQEQIRERSEESQNIEPISPQREAIRHHEPVSQRQEQVQTNRPVTESADVKEEVAQLNPHDAEVHNRPERQRIVEADGTVIYVLNSNAEENSDQRLQAETPKTQEEQVNEAEEVRFTPSEELVSAAGRVAASLNRPELKPANTSTTEATKPTEKEELLEPKPESKELIVEQAEPEQAVTPSWEAEDGIVVLNEQIPTGRAYGSLDDLPEVPEAGHSTELETPGEESLGETEPRDQISEPRIEPKAPIADLDADGTLAAARFHPNNIVFLIDVSSSMAKKGKIESLKQSLHDMVDVMRDYDKIAIITYSRHPEVLMNATSGNKKDSIHLLIDNLQAEGLTYGLKGLEKAKEIVLENFVNPGNNEIILATDGKFTSNSSPEKEIYGLARKLSRQDIALSVVGFGTDDEALKLMKRLSFWGKGSFIEAEHSGQEMLVQEIKERSRIQN